MLIKNAPPVANFSRPTTDEADQNPQQERAMSTTTPTDFAAQQAADRLARLERGVLLEHPAGWAVMVTVRRSDSGPGLRGGDLEIDEVGDPWLVDGLAWNQHYEGARVPDDDGLSRALSDADADGWLLDEATDAVALEGN